MDVLEGSGMRISCTLDAHRSRPGRERAASETSVFVRNPYVRMVDSRKSAGWLVTARRPLPTFTSTHFIMECDTWTAARATIVGGLEHRRPRPGMMVLVCKMVLGLPVRSIVSEWPRHVWDCEDNLGQACNNEKAHERGGSVGSWESTCPRGIVHSAQAWA